MDQTHSLYTLWHPFADVKYSDVLSWRALPPQGFVNKDYSRNLIQNEINGVKSSIQWRISHLFTSYMDFSVSESKSKSNNTTYASDYGWAHCSKRLTHPTFLSGKQLLGEKVHFPLSQWLLRLYSPPTAVVQLSPSSCNGSSTKLLISPHRQNVFMQL